MCRRCGNYMCAGCSRGGTAAQCPSCRERTGGSSFPFSRERYELGALIDFCWERWKLKWQPLTIVSIAFIGVLYGVAFVGGFVSAFGMAFAGGGSQGVSGGLMIGMVVIQVLLQLVQIVLQIWLTLGFFAVVIDVLEGREAEVTTLFSRYDRLPSALLQLLLVYLSFLVFLLPAGAAYALVPGDEDTRLQAAMITGAVLFIPMIYFYMGMGFAMIELSYDRSSTAISSLRISYQMIDGHRLSLLGMGLVCAGVILAGLLACCIGMIPAYGLAAMLFCSLYLALRTPTPPHA